MTGAQTPAGGEDGPRIRRIAADDPEFDQLYAEVLAPAFTHDELSDADDLRQVTADGTTLVWASVAPSGQVLGGAVWEYEARFDLVLLAWLAVRPGLRGRSVGGPLLRASLDACIAAHAPRLALAEVSDPGRHTGDELHGDPDARLRFYRRHGARTLDLPYFQPALGPDRKRIPDLLLMVLHAHPDLTAGGTGLGDVSALRAYLRWAQRECEGQVGTDEQAMRLWRALERPGGVPFRD
ncbi:GNAT family N-acetyltransferase [Streptomyces sp. MS19]|uniref:GNAT family N-acetyltransferase n=1 Tax=Streptomyces sp. MS19 TaxID=3385972 RepID=UPI0039A35BD5